jgi:3-hydroxybutyryl-CoA dehydratase
MENMKTYYPGELQVGSNDCFELTADAELIDAFTRLSGDVNPLHNDVTFAREAGYKNRIAHGALQQAFISRMAGVCLPGRFCFIKKLSTTYLAPVYEGEKLNIQGELTRLDGGNESGQLKVCITASAGNEVKSIPV